MILIHVKYYNSIPTVYISKEIIQHKDNKVFNILQKQQHLQQSLLKPLGKLSNLNTMMDSTRYYEDYLLHPTFKIFHKLEIIGFTLNPEYVQGSSISSYILYYYQVSIIYI